MLYQLSYAPWAAGRECSLGLVQRRALTLLFTAIAVALSTMSVYAALSGGRTLIVAAAAALALWMGNLAQRMGIRKMTDTPGISLDRVIWLPGGCGRCGRTTGKHATMRSRSVRSFTYAPLVNSWPAAPRGELPAHVDDQDLVSYGLFPRADQCNRRFDPDREIKFENVIGRIGAIMDDAHWTGCRGPSALARARSSERSSTSSGRFHRAPTAIAAKVGITTGSSTACPRYHARRWLRRSTAGHSGQQPDRPDRHDHRTTRRPTRSSLEQTKMKEALGEAIARLPSAKARRHPLLLREVALRDRRECCGVTGVPRLAVHTKAVLRFKAPPFGGLCAARRGPS